MPFFRYRWHMIVLAAVGGLAVAGLSAAGEPEPEPDAQQAQQARVGDGVRNGGDGDGDDDAEALRERVARLVEQLGHESYVARERAHLRLLEMGPRIIPLLEPYLDHEDAEIAARLKAIRAGYAWMSRGALIFRIEPGSQAQKLGLAPGDVVLRINHLDVLSINEIRQVSDAEQRRLHLLTARGIRTVTVEPGRIGIWLSEWEEEAGGQDQLDGIRALADERTWPRAHELIGRTLDRGIEEPWAVGVMAGLSAHVHQHKQAMRFYHRVARQPGQMGDLHYLLGSLADRLPVVHLEVADALERIPRLERTSGAQQEALEELFTRRAASRAMLNRLLGQPEDAFKLDDMTMLQLRTPEASVLLALHQRDYSGAARGGSELTQRLTPLLPTLVNLAVVRQDAMRLRVLPPALLQRVADGEASFDAEELAAVPLALLSAHASGRADLRSGLGAAMSSLSDEHLLKLWTPRMQRLALRPTASRALLPLYGPIVGPEAPAAARLGVLGMKLGGEELDLATWQEAFERLTGGLQARDDAAFVGLDVMALLRLGRYDQALERFATLEPTEAERERFHRRVDLLRRLAQRSAEAGWEDVPRAVEAIAAAGNDDGCWIVRHDGRVVYVDWQEGLDARRAPRGMPAGSVPIDPRRPSLHEVEGTLYWRDPARPGALPYRFDAEAARWHRLAFDAEPPPLGTHRERLLLAARLAADRAAGAAPDAEPPLVINTHPLGEDRLLVRLERDRLMLAGPRPDDITELGRHIAGRLEREEPVAVYRIHAPASVAAPTAAAAGQPVLIPTSHGLWAMDADADDPRRVDLGLHQQDVPVRIMAWPKREGRIYVGVVPQAGGAIVELRGPDLQPRRTGGFNGKGPQDEFAADLPTLLFELALRKLIELESQPPAPPEAADEA